MEHRSDGMGDYLIAVGKLGWELLTGNVDLGGGQTADLGPARVPLVGPMRATVGTPADQLAPTYADAAREAARRSPDYSGAPVNWKLLPGGELASFSPPATVRLTDYDPVTGHHVADIFARWYTETFLTGRDGNRANTLANQLRGRIEGMEPGRPLTEPFWVEATIDGADRAILVQVFERWTLTYTPDNPEGWQVELGNAGLHHHEWRHGIPNREAARRDEEVIARLAGGGQE
jgi:hypothetical protein